MGPFYCPQLDDELGGVGRVPDLCFPTKPKPPRYLLLSGCSEGLGFPRPEFESGKRPNFSEHRFFIGRMQMITSTSYGDGEGLRK